MPLLDLNHASNGSLAVGGQTSLNPGQYIINPLVHSLEQPINNMLSMGSMSEQNITGLGVAVAGLTRVVPYFLAGWLVWTAAEMYFPDEVKIVGKRMGRAAKRMRLR